MFFGSYTDTEGLFKYGEHNLYHLYSNIRIFSFFYLVFIFMCGLRVKSTSGQVGPNQLSRVNSAWCIWYGFMFFGSYTDTEGLFKYGEHNLYHLYSDIRIFSFFYLVFIFMCGVYIHFNFDCSL